MASVEPLKLIMRVCYESICLRESKTNYGTMVHIVCAATRKDADILVKGQVWPDAYVDVLDLDEEGIIYVAEPTG